MTAPVDRLMCVFMHGSCAKLESFVRTLTRFFGFFYLLIRGGRIQIPLQAGHHRPVGWRPDDGPKLNDGFVAVSFIRLSGPALLKNPIFCDF